MPVTTKENHARMTAELITRMNTVANLFRARALHHPKEGVKRKTIWTDPDRMVATHGSKDEIRLAISDLLTILKEVERL